jgi:hypothetical protein
MGQIASRKLTGTAKSHFTTIADLGHAANQPLI